VTASILLRGGLLADGVAATTRPADLLIEGSRIAAITPGGTAAPAGKAPASNISASGTVSPGDAAPPGVEVIDLPPGSVICPGFIDAHAHAEGPLLTAGRVDGALAQGVTTLVVGQDGQSWIGASGSAVAYLNRYFAPVNGALGPPWLERGGGLSVAGYAAAVSGRLAQNVAILASQGTIRHNVAGLHPGPLSEAERATARRQVQDALDAGAVGLSSGLDYLPSRHGGSDEIADLAQPLAAASRPYVSHLRGYGRDVQAGLAELVAVGHRSGARVHASHLWGRPADIEAAFRLAEAAGVAVTFDMYPYRRSSTILPVLLLPPDVQTGGPAQTLAALTDPARRAALLTGEKLTADYLRDIYLGCLPAGPDGHAESGGDAGPDGHVGLDRYAGLSVAEAAARDGRPPGEWVLDLLVRADLNVGAHLDRPTLAAQDLDWLLADRRFAAGSDGIYQGQHPHPRGYGAFARLAGHFLADDAGAAYQRIARHLAAHAADAYGLADRGRLAPGLAADICVIAPGGLIERASDADPRQTAAGVSLVLVNGVVTWRDGQPVPDAAGGRVVN
jgi:N-acyl-D-amino-acid deacylase